MSGLDDKSVASFLNARRKFIAGVVSIAGVLFAAHAEASLAVQAIIGFLGAYGIHEVAND